MFSSGTTGPQKAVLLSHRNLQYEIAVCRHPHFDIIDSKPLIFAPLSHFASYLPLICGLVFGFSSRIIIRFEIDAFLNIVERNEINRLMVVTPVATMMMKTDKYRLSSLTDIMMGAAPVSAELETALRKQFPQLRSTRQVYGMTESSCMICGTPAGAPVSKVGSAGVPVPGVEMKVVDVNTGHALGPHLKGEVCVRSPHVMLGYANNPRATAATIRNGWLHTGDIGYYDADGYFFVIDRLKELIKYKAHQVPPSELEAVLMSHSDVSDAAVVGIPDDDAGELPLAWVIRKPTSSVTETQLQQYVNDRVAPFKKLRGGVQFVTSIPKTPSGKILRRVIKASLQKAKL